MGVLKTHHFGGTIWVQLHKVETVASRLSPLANAGLHVREETRYQPPDIWASEEREMSLNIVRRPCRVSPGSTLIEPGLSRDAVVSGLGSVHAQLDFPLLRNTDAAAAGLIVRHAVL